jgi:putative oxidoreductase
MSTDTIAVKPSATYSSAVVLIGRVLLSSLFILAGYAKLTGLAGTAGWFGSIGLPLPMVTAVVVGLLELFGGLAILVGFQTRLAAVALAIFTLAATAIAHMDFGDQMQVLLFQKNISITGGLLILAAFGAGALSIDNRR